MKTNVDKDGEIQQVHTVSCNKDEFPSFYSVGDRMINLSNYHSDPMLGDEIDSANYGNRSNKRDSEISICDDNNDNPSYSAGQHHVPPFGKSFETSFSTIMAPNGLTSLFDTSLSTHIANNETEEDITINGRSSFVRRFQKIIEDASTKINDLKINKKSIHLNKFFCQ